MKNLLFSRRLQLAFAFLILVFVIDIVTPIGLGVNMLYLFCFFLILEENRSYILGFGVLIIGALLVHMLVNYSKIWNWMLSLLFTKPSTKKGRLTYQAASFFSFERFLFFFYHSLRINYFSIRNNAVHIDSGT